MKYKDLNLRAIREACDLDFAHYTFAPGMCSCCYGPQDLPSMYWRDRKVAPESKHAYSNCNLTKEGFSTPIDDESEFTYLLFKNADNGAGHVRANDEIREGYIQWAFPLDRLDKVCSMLQEQLGDDYEIVKPDSPMRCIKINKKIR